MSGHVIVMTSYKVQHLKSSGSKKVSLMSVFSWDSRYVLLSFKIQTINLIKDYYLFQRGNALLCLHAKQYKLVLMSTKTH